MKQDRRRCRYRNVGPLQGLMRVFIRLTRGRGSTATLLIFYDVCFCWLCSVCFMILGWGENDC